MQLYLKQMKDDCGLNKKRSLNRRLFCDLIQRQQQK